MHKLGVIVPFRNRWDHLNLFYQKAIRYIRNRIQEFEIIIVEQDDASAFNRGMLCNIGFIKAKELGCDYVIFHDVDLLPNRVDYSYCEHPVHLVSDELPFETYFGGITLFPTKDFEKINGFSNHYWGWGFEDDDLRYRCDLSKIDYGVLKESKTKKYSTTSYLNGIDAYIELENKIRFTRDFSIELDIKVGEVNFNPDKTVDYFTILSIPGYDFNIKFNSFNRFILQLFDTKGNYYDITSNIIVNRGNKIVVNYIAKEKTISLQVNDDFYEAKVLEYKIHNYTSEDTVYLGTNSNKEEFFKGSLDYLKIVNSNLEILEIDNTKIKNYSWVDTSGNNTRSKFSKVEIKNYDPKEYQGNRVPYRRTSRLKRLSHEDSGFVNGRWKHDMTRWNQVRFNNEVVNGDKDHKLDGLSTCKFTQHSKERKGKVLHIKVGI